MSKKKIFLRKLKYIDISFTYLGEIATGLPNSPRGVYITPTGDKAFVLNYSNSNIYVYDMSSNHDITTAVHSGTFAFGIESCFGLCFSDNGLNVFSQHLSSGRLYRCTLSTPFDLSTKGAVQSSIDYPNYLYYYGIEINSDGSKYYSTIQSGAYNKINRYDLSTNYDITTSSYIENYNIDAYWFRFMYSGAYIITGKDNIISLYRLTTPYNISTAILLKTKAFPTVVYYANIGDSYNLYTVHEPNTTRMLRQYSLNITGI